ncbi:copper chaperone PCu(A)C [Streptomyces orinoci]|uniref:Copper chaperone PCu(A)C n=1 Tax=Streptomyces orinoci TaxID=67339 RepID=A0ABV3K5I9_STRON|nr:copper chaperone PCu(A)C [Streptomyces orinoci]
MRTPEPLRALRAALVPLAACALTLAGLGAWTASGAAGRPARITASDARVLLPFGTDDTAAFVRLRNDGDEDDRLLDVEVPSAYRAMLSRTVTRNAVSHMEMVSAATVPAHGSLSMSPRQLDIMISRPPRLRLGDRLPLVLTFARSGVLRVTAEVVRPGTG